MALEVHFVRQKQLDNVPSTRIVADGLTRAISRRGGLPVHPASCRAKAGSALSPAPYGRKSSSCLRPFRIALPRKCAAFFLESPAPVRRRSFSRRRRAFSAAKSAPAGGIVTCVLERRGDPA